MRKTHLIFLLILFSIFLYSEDEIIRKKMPLKAAVFSCIMPAGGQLYNGKLLKSGFVFVIEGSFIGLAIHHHNKAEKYYDRYKASLSVSDYSEYVKYYEKRQSDLFWIGTIIFLSAIDAYVDAHLFNFEEKKNKIHLKFEHNMIGLAYNF